MREERARRLTCLHAAVLDRACMARDKPTRMTALLFSLINR
jgi:hypothetical protein